MGKRWRDGIEERTGSKWEKKKKKRRNRAENGGLEDRETVGGDENLTVCGGMCRSTTCALQVPRKTAGPSGPQ